MHLILCVDTRSGLSFAGRRLSSDSVLTGRILKMTENSRLWIAPYSEKLFLDQTVHVAPDYLQKAAQGDYCFLEQNIHMVPRDRVESVTLCCWNRSYPATEKFPREWLGDMRLVHTEEFPGTSHDTITLERYVP